MYLVIKRFLDFTVSLVGFILLSPLVFYYLCFSKNANKRKRFFLSKVDQVKTKNYLI